MTRFQACWLRKGDRVLLEEGKEVTLLAVPWGFPWLWCCVTIDSGWDVHYTRIISLVWPEKEGS